MLRLKFDMWNKQKGFHIRLLVNCIMLYKKCEYIENKYLYVLFKMIAVLFRVLFFKGKGRKFRRPFSVGRFNLVPNPWRLSSYAKCGYL